MIRFEDAQRLQEVLDPRTEEDMRTIVLFLKHVRGRCRSDAALKNYLNSMFPRFRFEQVEKMGERGPYKSLQIHRK